MKPNFSLVDFSPEESPIVLKKFNDFMTENSIHLTTKIVVKENGTLKSEVGLMKKVELVPKLEHLS